MVAAAENDCGSIAENGGMVSPAKAREAMMRADLLLLLSPATEEGGIPGGKLYEYLGGRTAPILALPATDRYVMQVLRDTKAGEGALTPEEIAEALARPPQEPVSGSHGLAFARRPRKLHLVGTRPSTGGSPRPTDASRKER